MMGNCGFYRFTHDRSYRFQGLVHGRSFFFGVHRRHCRSYSENQRDENRAAVEIDSQN